MVQHELCHKADYLDLRPQKGLDSTRPDLKQRRLAVPLQTPNWEEAQEVACYLVKE